MDFKQIVAALLTMSMFVMLGNMIKKDHIDPLFEVNVPAFVGIQQNVISKVSRLSGPWKDDAEAMKPCWKKFSTIKNQKGETNGHVLFSLTNGPEYHALQVANAIFIAKHLGATLVLPDVKGIKVSKKRNFGEIYDIKKFMTSLDGVAQVVKNQFDYHPKKENINIVKVPTRVTKEFISSSIEPIFRKTKQVRLASHYHSLTLTKAYERSDFLNPYTCLAMFGSLKLQPELQELVDTMVKTLQFMSLKSSGGKFIAIDLGVEDFKMNLSCHSNVTRSKQSCSGAQEIGQWLKNIGFGRDTTIYVTQAGWHKSLQPLREYFPNIFTKDSLMPTDMKARYLNSENVSYEKYIDFYLCVQSNVFVATSLNLFYASVAGLRIASGNTQILVPPRRSSTSSMNYLSPYILNKSHMAYSCLC